MVAAHFLDSATVRADAEIVADSLRKRTAANRRGLTPPGLALVPVER